LIEQAAAALLQYQQTGSRGAEQMTERMLEQADAMVAMLPMDKQLEYYDAISNALDMLDEARTEKLEQQAVKVEAKIDELEKQMTHVLSKMDDLVADIVRQLMDMPVSLDLSEFERQVREMQHMLERAGLRLNAAAAAETTETIPALQHGGIVTRPTLALLGEAGPEAVVPLRPGRMPGAALNVTVNAANPLDPYVVERIGQEMGRLTRRGRL
jgi:archaellum component FlaC